MRRMTGALAVCICIALVGCGKAEPTHISFIGIGTGTLATDVNAIRFRNTFRVNEMNLVAVVAFSSIPDQSVVQATWFMPDERSKPLGRTNIVTHSGSTIARFSFGSRKPWKPGPYLLRVDASTGPYANLRTASGTTSFFIGMSDQEIEKYKREYDAWKQSNAATQTGTVKEPRS